METERTTGQLVDDLIHNQGDMLDIVNEVNATHDDRRERRRVYDLLRQGVTYERFSLASLRAIRRIEIVQGKRLTSGQSLSGLIE